MPRVYAVDTPSQREKILRTADRLLRREGLPALTMRRVASKLSVTPMSIYRHFRDKEALLQVLVARGFERWEARLADAVQAPTARGRIENALRAYREFALEEPRYFELMFLVARPGIPLAPESLRATPSPSFGAVVAAVQESMAAGDLMAGDPGEIILMMWALAHGLVALHFTGRFGFDEARFRRSYDAAIETLLSRLSTVPRRVLQSTLVP